MNEGGRGVASSAGMGIRKQKALTTKDTKDHKGKPMLLGGVSHPLRSGDEAADALLQMDNVKVDDESKRFAAELEIRDDLRLMDWRDSFYGLDFYDDEILHE